MTDQPPPVPAPSPYQSVQRWSAGCVRELSLPVAEVRTAVLQVVRALGFATTAEQYSAIQAERGSKLRGLSLTPARMPISLQVSLAATDRGTRLEARLEDRWPTTGRSAAAVAVYADVFTEVLSRLDEHLRRLDPDAAAGFGEWWRVLPEALIAQGASGAAGAARVESALARGSARLLNGPRRGPTQAASGAGVRSVNLRAPDAFASLPADTVDGMLTAGSLVAAAPGPMPKPMVAQVEALVVQLEARLAAAVSGWQPDLLIEVPAEDKPVVTFLFQQAGIREKLPVRVLMTCTTCRLEKVVNPDYLKLRERNRRVRVLQTSVGAVLGAHQVSPFILFGRLAQLKKIDPEFVCTRCQGTDADERPITFCPRCGERRDESVLRSCAKCSLDLRSLLDGSQVWQALPEEPDEPAVLEPPPYPPAFEVPPPPQVMPGWYPDPSGRYEIRFHDGSDWTAHVGAGGVLGVDPPTELG